MTQGEDAPFSPSQQLNADALLSFQLRGRLAEITFGNIWSLMPALGWKYSKGAYIAPDGKNLGTAKEAMEKLDSCALQCLTFRNDHGQERQEGYGGSGGANAIDDTSLDELKEIRKDLLTAIFQDCKEKETLLPCFYFDKDMDEMNVGNKSHDNEEKDQESKHDAHIPTRSKTSKYSSATSNELGTDRYFKKSSNQLSKKQIEKSDAATRGLKWPSPKDCTEAVRLMTELSHEKEHNDDHLLQSKYLDQYSSEWKFLMTTRHSLLLFGYGSKRKLLNDFASKELNSDGDVLTLNGFDPSISIVQILDVVVQLFLNGIDPSPIPHLQACQEDNDCGIGMLRTPNGSHSHVVQRAISIGKALGARHPKPIYLVIHNIDGVGLRSGDAQRALAALVLNSRIANESSPEETLEFENIRLVRIVASVDHVDAPLFLWDMETANNFSWVWKEVNTWDPYYDEVKIGISEESRKIKSTKRQMLDFVFMQKVLKSVAPKHTDILKILATMQINEGQRHSFFGEEYEYVRLDQWQNKCFKDFQVSKSSEFQSMVKELSDHNMIQIRQDFNAGIDFVCIPTSKSKVQEILKSLRI